MNIRRFHIAVAVWILAASFVGFGETYQSRPSRAELDKVLTLGTECGYAVSERELAASGGKGQASMRYCGSRQNYVESLQRRLEGVAPMYVDHVNGPFNDTADAVQKFTLETWRSAAGLNSSGFCRYDSDGKLSYGIVRQGDSIGALIFEDLQKGFSALKWTAGILWESIWHGAGHGTGQYPDIGRGWGEALEKANREWPNGGLYSSQPHAFTAAGRDQNSRAPQFNVDVCRGKSAPRCSTATIKHTISFYVRGSWVNSAESIYDDFGDGVSEGSFYLKESAAESESSDWVGKAIGNTNKPAWCAQPTWKISSQSRGYICDGICIIKYSFTDSH